MDEKFDSGINIPKRKRGRPTVESAEEHAAQTAKFCDFIKRTADTLDYRPSARGWAYLLENERIINKSQLDAAERCINDARKSGALPLDICAQDAKREWKNVEQLDNADPADEAARIKQTVASWISTYHPRSFWQGKPYYLQMVGEKIDLRELFLPVCKPWYIPIANGGGWSDINMRGEMMIRFRDHLEPGQIPVVLYCGDFDPVGLQISDTLRENMRQLSKAVGWWDDALIVDRFGLNFDFIQKHKLTWIDNLQTSGKGRVNDLADPRHAHHHFPHVQDYIAKYGARKVEANALVTRAQAGRELCKAAILKYMKDTNLPERFENELAPGREVLREKLRKIWSRR